MVVSDCEDSLTRLNTELNRSMVLMETNDTMEKSPKMKSKSRKSITINTSLIVASTNTPAKKSETRKSILKKNKKIDEKLTEENEDDEVDEEEQEELPENNRVISTTLERPKHLNRRPHTLDEYIQNDSLSIDPTASSFTINEIDEDDELWLFDIPKTLNPHELKGQTFYFGDRTKFKVGNERYVAISNDNTEYLTCIMGTGRETKRFKTVNVQPSGTIIIRKKLSNVGNHFSVNDDDEELNSTVPFPENLKIRHPLMNIGKSEKRLKKSSSIKSRIKKRKDETSD